jgi:hypothetical protein
MAAAAIGAGVGAHRFELRRKKGPRRLGSALANFGMRRKDGREIEAGSIRSLR